jgi:hypothetical protein
MEPTASRRTIQLHMSSTRQFAATRAPLVATHLVLVRPIQRSVVIAVFCSATFLAIAASVNTDYITPPFTFTPDHRYGVMIPVFHIEAAQEPDDRMNKVVELRTHRIVAVIHGEPGYDRALNFHETAPPLWSADSSVLLWKVKGKWFPDALVLLKLEKDQEKWQLDLLKAAQQAILSRTKNAAPERYVAAKEANAGNGSAYPDGFTVDVITDEDKIAFPFHVLADLTANPKQIEGFPVNLESHLDAVVTEDGKFIVKEFKLGRRFQ